MLDQSEAWKLSQRWPLFFQSHLLFHQAPQNWNCLSLCWGPLEKEYAGMNSYSFPMYPWASYLRWVPALVSPSIFLQNSGNNSILQGFIFFFYTCLCIVYVMGVCYSATWRSEFSVQGQLPSSTVCVPGVAFRTSGLVSGAFTEGTPANSNTWPCPPPPFPLPC